jgi:hypothetical protein
VGGCGVIPASTLVAITKKSVAGSTAEKKIFGHFERAFVSRSDLPQRSPAQPQLPARGPSLDLISAAPSTSGTWLLRQPGTERTAGAGSATPFAPAVPRSPPLTQTSPTPNIGAATAAGKRRRHRQRPGRVRPLKGAPIGIVARIRLGSPVRVNLGFASDSSVRVYSRPHGQYGADHGAT